MTQYNSDHLIVWDLETTGFVGDEKAQIIEIGAMIFEGPEMKLVSEHNWILNHGIEIPEKITEITGITKEIIDRDGREAIICLREFTDLLMAVIRGGGMHLTHNGFRFDIPFLVKQHAHFQIMDEGYQKEFRTMLESCAVDSAVIFKGRKLGYTQRSDESNREYADRVMDTRAFGLKFNVGICCDELGISREGIEQHRSNADVYLTSEIFKKLIASS